MFKKLFLLFVIPLQLSILSSCGVQEKTPEIKLGEALYYDPIVSGNKDISCATCHHPLLGTTDNRRLPIGTGGIGLGPYRIKPPNRDLVGRNAPDVFNRGDKEWHTMFWDGRVEQLLNGTFKSPAGDQLPDGLKNVLAVQALFPPTARVEMRGFKGENDLADIEDGNFTEIWNKLMERILSIPEYRQMFKDAYGDREYTIADFGNAIAAYEEYAFTLNDRSVMSLKAIKGKELFYGKANCSKCHSGKFFTDQKYHNIGVPSFGPRKDDKGRGDYKFRTPPLNNVALTYPYMHDGIYSDLDTVIRHHINPEYYLRLYNPNRDLTGILSTLEVEVPPLSDTEIDYLIAFLESLTDPRAKNKEYMESLIPDRVPSNLPIDH